MGGDPDSSKCYNKFIYIAIKIDLIDYTMDYKNLKKLLLTKSEKCFIMRK